MGATYSVLNQCLSLQDETSVNVVGATGQRQKAHFLKPLKYKLGKSIGIHKFLYMPDTQKSLLGRDLLEKLETTIEFKASQVQFKVKDDKFIDILSLALTTPEVKTIVPQEILNQVYPGVWASGKPRKAKNVDPIIIKLKPGMGPVRIKQYPLKLEDRKGVKPIIDDFLKYKLIIECESEYSTPILLIKNPNGVNYRLVQDLRPISKI